MSGRSSISTCATKKRTMKVYILQIYKKNLDIARVAVQFYVIIHYIEIK